MSQTSSIAIADEAMQLLRCECQTNKVEHVLVTMTHDFNIPERWSSYCVVTRQDLKDCGISGLDLLKFLSCIEFVKQKYAATQIASQRSQSATPPIPTQSPTPPSQSHSSNTKSPSNSPPRNAKLQKVSQKGKSKYLIFQNKYILYSIFQNKYILYILK